MRIILIHGFNASPEMNFHPWLARTLREEGHTVIAPALPLKTDSDVPLSAIIEQMRKEIGFLKNDDIIVGHSLGALLVLQYLEAVEMTETPRAVVMVATPWKVGNPALRRLFMAELDADVLMWKAREYVVVHSKDDKLVPLKHAQTMASALKARLVLSETDDHFMEKEYPSLLSVLQEIIASPFTYAPGQSLTNDFAL